MSNPSFLTFPNLQSLIYDMDQNHVEKDQFSFTYKLTFDVIVAIVENGYELLISLRETNFGFVVPVNERFIASIKPKDYFKLCDHLNLTSSKDHFTSNVFLRLLSSKIPCKYSGRIITYRDMIPYCKCKQVEESEKIYFKGWNLHIADKRQAQNFSKTEFYFGKEVADYCRKNNISSIWTDDPKYQKEYYRPDLQQE